MLQNAYLIAKIGVDTAENEPTYVETYAETYANLYSQLACKKEESIKHFT